jgi:hypothetical protein
MTCGHPASLLEWKTEPSHAERRFASQGCASIRETRGKKLRRRRGGNDFAIVLS